MNRDKIGVEEYVCSICGKRFGLDGLYVQKGSFISCSKDCWDQRDKIAIDGVNINKVKIDGSLIIGNDTGKVINRMEIIEQDLKQIKVNLEINGVQGILTGYDSKQMK